MSQIPLFAVLSAPVGDDRGAQALPAQEVTLLARLAAAVAFGQDRQLVVGREHAAPCPVDRRPFSARTSLRAAVAFVTNGLLRLPPRVTTGVIDDRGDRCQLRERCGAQDEIPHRSRQAHQVHKQRRRCQ